MITLEENPPSEHIQTVVARIRNKAAAEVRSQTETHDRDRGRSH